MKKFVKTCLLTGAILSGTSAIWAQDGSVDLYELSLDELMNISVVSASKEEERLFDAPVAAYTLSRDEISKAGILSIPEALRLIPGVIVRETTNGNYDIHLRGFENPTHYTNTSSQINSLTLVMINNRPVFNYNQGGTFWESLPVDIADVERIEVVAGPSAPLFGPNAVTGVINIITREFNQKNLLVSGQLQMTAPGNGLIGNLALGKQFSEKISVGLTGNFQERDRTDDEQYIYGMGYVKSRDYRKDEVAAAGLNPELALSRKGINGYATLKPADGIRFDLSGGWQGTEAQKVHFLTASPLVFNEISSFYGNLNSQIKSLNLRLSYTNGQDELHKLSSYNSTTYDYRLAEASVDYDFRFGSKIKVRPSLNYQSSTYSDLNYLEGYPLGGLLNAEKTLGLLAASLRTEYTPLKGLRLVGSARADKFDVRDDLFVSYQLAATYSPTTNWLFRAVHGKSYSGMFFNTAFIDATGVYSERVLVHVVENQDVALTSNTLTEIGVRAQLKGNLQADLSLFSQKLDNPMNLVETGKVQPLPSGQFIVDYQYEALPITAHQLGLTASVNWLPNKQWQLRPFISLQSSNLRNFDVYSTPQLPVPSEREHSSTPNFYGGWFVNYTPFNRLNLSTSSYFFSKHTLYHQQDMGFANKEGEISGKLLLNARASYRVYNKLNVFAGAKNLLNQNTREYYGTDRMGSSYFAGLSYNL